MLLTKQEVIDIHLATGDIYELAEGIESALLAKAGEHSQAPYVFFKKVKGKDEWSSWNEFSDGSAGGKPLFEHPLPAQAIPEGWQLVPIEPTVGMDDEYARASGQHHLSLRGYKAMLSASPKP